MIIFLSGKMSGLADYGRAKFKAVEEKLTKQGKIVLNPACLPIGLNDDSYMQISLAMLQAADAIYMIDGWQDSKGAKLEKQYAEYQGKKVFYEGEND